MLLTNTILIHDGLDGQDCTHLSVTEIDLCNEHQDAEYWARAEYSAEMAAERHHEDRGYWDAREQEDEEARRGVIQFEDAYAHALGYLDAGEREWAETQAPDLADMLDQERAGYWD